MGGRVMNIWRLVAGALSWLGVRLLLGLVGLYRVLLSPLLGRHCRYEPTCSCYFREAVLKYGAIRGTARGLARICRCHPWRPGGYDPP